jgi:UDP-N-acetylmuramyl pentapeptide phosphotransferase/UDP-N-acetylglucosamine-1-phosphate transferase
MSLLLRMAIPVVVLLAAWRLTGHMLRYALAQRLLDVPNARSSHSVVTPRGGGVAIVIGTLVAFLVAGQLRLIPWPIVLGLVGGGTWHGAGACSRISRRAHGCCGYSEDCPRFPHWVPRLISAGWATC